MRAADLMRLIRKENPEDLGELRHRVRQAETAILGVREGLDPTKLEETGWGVIFPTYSASDPDRDKKEKQVEAVREALQPLLQLRQKQASERFREWCQGAGKGFHVHSDSKNGYLARHSAAPGPADPERVPYYLLIVGDLNEIPYRFQYLLDVQYAVGRLHFETPAEYAEYAATVVAVETGQHKSRPQAAFFGVANQDDPATQYSTSLLVSPLAKTMRATHPDWDVQCHTHKAATKATLASLLGGSKTPGLLFTASHGMCFAHGSAHQDQRQGALLCQDWPGPVQWRRKIPQDFYFAGDDLPSHTDLSGLIAFFFACYGLGTPRFDEFASKYRPSAVLGSPPELAPAPFLARLPVKMLGQPRGALAVVGNMDRAYSYSFEWGGAGAQTIAFESALERLLKGHPIGSAMEFFNQRYAELATMLSDELMAIEFERHYDPLEVAGMWTACNDARGYAILGDPAVRLPLAQINHPVQ